MQSLLPKICGSSWVLRALRAVVSGSGQRSILVHVVLRNVVYNQWCVVCTCGSGGGRHGLAMEILQQKLVVNGGRGELHDLGIRSSSTSLLLKPSQFYFSVYMRETSKICILVTQEVKTGEQGCQFGMHVCTDMRHGMHVYSQQCEQCNVIMYNIIQNCIQSNVKL